MIRNLFLLVISLTVCAATQAQESVAVPSDPSARYTLLEVTKRQDGLIESLTRRDGRSGTSYAKRLIDCSGGTFKYLAEGDTLASMKASGGSNPMGRLTPAWININLRFGSRVRKRAAIDSISSSLR